MTYDVIVDGKTHRLELTRGETTWLCKVDDEMFEVDAALTARDVMSVLVGDDAFEVKRERSLQGELHLVIGSARYAVVVQRVVEKPARKKSPLPCRARSSASWSQSATRSRQARASS